MKMKQILKMALVVMMVAFAVITAGCGEENDYHKVKADTIKLVNDFQKGSPDRLTLENREAFLKVLKERELVIHKNMMKLEKLADAEPKLRPDLEDFKNQVVGDVYRNGLRNWVGAVNHAKKRAGKTDFEPIVKREIYHGQW